MATRFAGQGDTITDSGVQKWINVFGDVQLIKNIDRMRTTGQRKIMRKAIRKGIKPIARIAKSRVHDKTGLLRRSIKTKVTRMISGKIYVDPKVIAVKSSATGGKWMKVKAMRNGKTARAGYREIRQAIIKQNPDAHIRKPANYAHLVEFGTRTAKAHPFMRPALHAGRSQALGEIQKTAKQEFDKIQEK